MSEVPRIDGRGGSTAKGDQLSAEAPGPIWDFFALRLSASATERGADYSSPSWFLISADDGLELGVTWENGGTVGRYS